MKFISTRVHAVLDYIIALVLIFAPEIFGFADFGGAAVGVPRFVGIVILLQALMTDYDFSLARLIPMRTHLVVDYVLGIFLAISPWLFGFADAPRNAWLPHLLVGLGVFLIALFTQPEPRRVGLAPERGVDRTKRGDEDRWSAHM